MKQVVKFGFLQALGVAAYITLVGLFMWNGNTIFGKQDSFITPIIVLTLLSVSVLVCAIIVLYKPYKLFITGKKKEAVETVVYTAVGLFILLILFIAGFLIFR